MKCLCKLLPAQFLPSPVYPTRQLQVYDPSVLLHSALVSHSFVSGLAHSSISVSKVGVTDNIEMGFL